MASSVMSDSQLKQVSGVFKETYKPYALGVFQIPSKPAVAEAQSKGKLRGGRTASGVWSAIGGVLGRKSVQTDFTQERYTLSPEWAYYPEFGFRGNPKEAVSGFLSKVTDRPLVVEIHEENAALKKAITSAGGKYLLTKINAFSQVRAQYIFGLKPQEVWRPTPLIETLTLALVTKEFIDTATIKKVLKEIERYHVEWAQHYSKYNKKQSWTAFALRGYVREDPTFIIKPKEMTKAWKEENPAVIDNPIRDTVAASRFPELMKIVGRIPGDKDRVRLMRLTPQGELSRHCDITDQDAGVADGKVIRLHVPLVTNPEVDFHAVTSRGEDLKIHMNPGSLYYLDQRKPHFVENRNPELERVHLVIDAFSTPRLRDALEHAKEGASA